MPPTLVFIQVPEGKTVKNRLHLDVSPVDGSTEDEASRLLALGATKVDVGQGPGRSWVVMADPRATSSTSCAPWHRPTRRSLVQ